MDGAAVLERVRAACDEGRFVDAYREGAGLGGLASWPREGLGLASKIALHLGAPGLSDRLDLRAYRRAPRDTEAFLGYLGVVHKKRGPLAAHGRLAARERAHGGSRPAPLIQARAYILIEFRDFGAAEEALEEAEKGPHEATLQERLRAALLGAQDRHDEAERRLRAALEASPDDLRLGWDLAGSLRKRGDLEGALRELSRLGGRAQSLQVQLARVSLLTELSRHEEARAALEGLERHFPLIEPELSRLLAAQRSEVAYGLGDVAASIREARASENPMLRRVADRMEQRPEGRRLVLGVPYVRQHHLTCAPATLASIFQFWGHKAEHAEIAEKICYDGTPDYSERSWAEGQGWSTREFTVTWAAAVELLLRGVPFTLATTEAHASHLQAAVGFDERRGTLLLRDPSTAELQEANADAFLEHYRAMGPRGMALVPPGHREKVPEDLPDASLRDTSYRLNLMLSERRRPEAFALLQELEQRAPGHLVALRARVALSAYDRDSAGLRRACEALHEALPRDALSRLMLAQSARNFSARSERIRGLEEALGKDDAHPMFAEALAAELLEDGRQAGRAGRLLRACARAMPFRGAPLALLSALARKEGRPAESAAMARLACCLDEFNEDFARNAAALARATGQTDRGLELLRRRSQRLGERSPAPIMTYCWALEQAGQQRAAEEELEKALREHPGDAQVQLEAARWLGKAGQLARASSLLSQAEEKADQARWFFASGELALREGDPRRALWSFRKLLSQDPFFEGAQGPFLSLLLATAGLDEARRYLDQLIEQFPRNRDLAARRLLLLSEGPPRAYEQALRSFIAEHPSDAWARRRLALLLARQRRAGEAREELREASQIDATSPEQHAAEAALLREAGDRAGAVEAYGKAFEADPDDPEPLLELLELLEHGQERALALALEAITDRATSGAAVRPWAELARAHLTPEQLEQGLSRLKEARPDLPAAFCGLADALLAQAKIGEAAALLEQAQGRFPLDEGVQVLLAEVAAERGDEEGERRHLSRAFQLAPQEPAITLRLSAFHEARGRAAESREILAHALGTNPLAAPYSVELARLAQQAGDGRRARELLSKVLRLSPRCDDAWELLFRLDAGGQPGKTLALAEEIAAEHPGNPELRCVVARVALASGEASRALAALDQADQLAPSDPAACELRMVALAQAGQPQQAAELGAPGRWGGDVPPSVAGRAADIAATSGDLPAAVEQMRGVLGRHPGYGWGWAKLGEWLEALGDVHGVVEARRQAVRLAPSSPSSLALLAEALEGLGAVAEARAILARASRLAPNDPKITYRQGHLALDDRDPGGAEQALARIRALSPGPTPSPSLLLLELRAAADQGQASRAQRALLELCRLEGLGGGVLEQARRWMLQAGMGKEAQKTLKKALSEKTCSGEVARLWVGTERARGAWGDERLSELQGELFRQALRFELSSRGASDQGSGVRALIERFAAAIDADDELWISSCGALLHSGHPLRALRRLSGHERRPAVDRQASIQAAQALWLLGARRRAIATSERYLEAQPRDEASLSHSLWLAYSGAVVGDLATARRHLTALDDTSLTPAFQVIRDVAEASIAYWESPPRERAYRRNHILRALEQADQPLSAHQRRLLSALNTDAADMLARGLDFPTRLTVWMEGPLPAVMSLGLLMLLLVAYVLSEKSLPSLVLANLALIAGILWFFRRPIARAL